MTYIKYFNLQIFAEGGGEGGAADGTGDAATAQAVETLAKSRESRNPLEFVQYGKTEDDAPEQVAAESPKTDRNAEFEKLIKGEYKEQYDKRISDTVKSRLKANQDTVDKYNKSMPLMEMIAQKYGVKDATDVDALMKAMENDNSYYEDAAMEMGVSVEQYKEIKSMERENKALKAQMEEQNTREQANALYSRWTQEAENCKQFYPNFDLQTELANEQFRNLLMSNINVQTAFEVIHKDEIIPAAMQYTAKQVESKLANKIKSGGMRPQEGGTSNSSSAVVKKDVSQLSNADLREINRRVARGERIVF